MESTPIGSILRWLDWDSYVCSSLCGRQCGPRYGVAISQSRSFSHVAGRCPLRGFPSTALIRRVIEGRRCQWSGSTVGQLQFGPRQPAKPPENRKRDQSHHSCSGIDRRRDSADRVPVGRLARATSVWIRPARRMLARVSAAAAPLLAPEYETETPRLAVGGDQRRRCGIAQRLCSVRWQDVPRRVALASAD